MRTLPTYDSYKDSGVLWLGKIPANWKVLRLKFLFQCLDGQRIPVSGSEREKRPGNIPYWGANKIVDYVDKALFNEALTLLGEDGAPFFDQNRPVAFYINGPIWPNNHIHVLRPKNVNAKYATYALNIVDYTDYIDGSTRDKLTQSKMNGIPLPYPTLQEQENIANFLDEKTAAIDDAIAKKRRLIELLQEQKGILINTAVTQGLDPHAPMKESGVEWIGRIPAHWEVIRNRYIFAEQNERSAHGTETRLSMSQKLGLVPTSELDVQTLQSETHEGAKLCAKGDLVLNRLKAHLAVFSVAPSNGIV